MKNRILMPLFWVMLLDTASYTIRFPVLTLVFFDNATRLFSPDESLALRSSWYGICMACYWIGSTLAAPILSITSDLIDRRRILLFGASGTFIFALATALGVLWGNILLILLGSIIGGLCARMDPIAQAIVGNVTKPEQKLHYMSYLQLFISIGALIGPIIGGYFAQHIAFAVFNFSLPFIIAALLALFGVIIVSSLFYETLNGRSKSSDYNFKFLFTKPIAKISLILILFQLSWSTYYQYIAPILKKVFQFGATEIGLFVGAIALWLAIAAALTTHVLQKYFSLTVIIRYAAFILLLGLLGTCLIIIFQKLWISHWLIWLLAIPVASGDVIAYCAITTLYSNAIAANMQGQVMAANFLVVSITWGLTSLLGGILLGINPVLPMVFALLSAIILIVLSFIKGIINDEVINVRSGVA